MVQHEKRIMSVLTCFVSKQLTLIYLAHGSSQSADIMAYGIEHYTNAHSMFACDKKWSACFTAMWQYFRAK